MPCARCGFLWEVLRVIWPKSGCTQALAFPQMQTCRRLRMAGVLRIFSALGHSQEEHVACRASRKFATKSQVACGLAIGRAGDNNRILDHPQESSSEAGAPKSGDAARVALVAARHNSTQFHMARCQVVCVCVYVRVCAADFCRTPLRESCIVSTLEIPLHDYDPKKGWVKRTPARAQGLSHPSNRRCKFCWFATLRCNASPMQKLLFGVGATQCLVESKSSNGFSCQVHFA